MLFWIESKCRGISTSFVGSFKDCLEKARYIYDVWDTAVIYHGNDRIAEVSQSSDSFWVSEKWRNMPI